jgi:copper oxidase (laccase) domain-containing protein
MASTSNNARFLNVDLEVWSDQPLDLLVATLADAVDVLFLGQDGDRHLARFELAGSGWQQTAASIVRELVDVMTRLPAPARVLWDTASERRFDFGYETPQSATVSLDEATVAAIAKVRGTIAVTLYPDADAESRPAKPA